MNNQVSAPAHKTSDNGHFLHFSDFINLMHVNIIQALACSLLTDKCIAFRCDSSLFNREIWLFIQNNFPRKARRNIFA